MILLESRADVESRKIASRYVVRAQQEVSLVLLKMQKQGSVVAGALQREL